MSRMSQLEETFAFQLAAMKLPSAHREYRFHDKRKWRFDFAWPEKKVAVEIEGGVWTGGRHTRGAGFIKDTEKYNTAALLGWKVLRFHGEAVKSGEAINFVQEALA